MYVTSVNLTTSTFMVWVYDTSSLQINVEMATAKRQWLPVHRQWIANGDEKVIVIDFGKMATTLSHSQLVASLFQLLFLENSVGDDHIP